MPTCVQMKAAEAANAFLMSTDPMNGKARLENIMEAWYRDRLDNPRFISLKDVTAVSKAIPTEQGNENSGLLDVFSEIDSEPTVVLEAEVKP